MTDLFQMLQLQANCRPDGVAICHDRGLSHIQTTWTELAKMARNFAFEFHSAGDSQIIPILLNKSAPCVAAMIGAIGAGKGFACLNKKLRAPQLINAISLMRPQLALIDPSGLTSLAEIAENKSVRETCWWLISDVPLTLPQQKVFQKLQQTIRFADPAKLNRDDVKALPETHSTPNRIGACLFTSGSTGVPKGVLVSQSDLIARAEVEMRWFDLRPQDVLLNLLPFSFDVGMNQVLSTIVTGCQLVLLDSWLPVDIARAVARWNVSGISAVPAIWQGMLTAGINFQTHHEHSTLRYITVSGGDMPPEQLRQLPQLAPSVGIFKTYGQSEAFRTTSLQPEEFESRPQSVGRAFSGARFYVVHDDNSLCGANEEGEIAHTGVGTMLGYLDNRDPQHKLRPNPFKSGMDHEPTAVYTGDLGYQDEDGYLFLTGRRDEMLKIAGNRIYPLEIVQQLLQLPTVQAAEVVGIKTDDQSTRLIAFVVLADSSASSSAIRELVAKRLPSFMVPAEILLLSAIPRTESGKPDRPALMELATKIAEESKP